MVSSLLVVTSIVYMVVWLHCLQSGAPEVSSEMIPDWTGHITLIQSGGGQGLSCWGQLLRTQNGKPTPTGPLSIQGKDWLQDNGECASL